MVNRTTVQGEKPMARVRKSTLTTRHAQWEIVSANTESLTIRDIGHEVGPSITNDAEWVVEQLADQLIGRRLYYYDSMGRLDEITHERQRFTGFKPGPGSHLPKGERNARANYERDQQVAQWEAEVKANPPRRVTDFNE